MHIGYLYVTSNSIDDVLYVGQSSQLDDEVVATYLGSGDYFKQALAEHGEHSFRKSILGYYDDQTELDYAEVQAIARLKAEGIPLYNGGVGGPRAQRDFIMAMFRRFRVVPMLADQWFQAVDDNHDEVRDLIAASADVTTDDFYVQLEGQLLQTQDLSGECPGCGAAVGAVCRTKTDRAVAQPRKARFGLTSRRYRERRSRTVCACNPSESPGSHSVRSDSAR
ncbi:hypothetical protein [Microbacterium sp.]|uniref:hypothetical protein n=1 Tax=Microbacterium sp. TaxID=51671 RepID=UPI0025D53D1C|nr:hypothetical protein [Microbacterium sp.]